MYIRVKFMRR